MELANGRRIAAEEGFDALLLRRLIAVLEGLSDVCHGGIHTHLCGHRRNGQEAATAQYLKITVVLCSVVRPLQEASNGSMQNMRLYRIFCICGLRAMLKLV